MFCFKTIKKQIEADGGINYFSYATGSDHELNVIFYQNANMKKWYASYGQVLYVDSTYKLTDRNYSCSVFVVQDSAGKSKIVAFALMSFEREIILDSIVKFFKAANNITLTKVIMIDKDLKEDKVLTVSFKRLMSMISVALLWSSPPICF